MPDIFATTPGGVYEFSVGQSALPFTVKVGSGVNYASLKGVVTSIGIQQQSNFQFLHTLRNLIYVYVFGERIADLTVGGTVFLSPCGTAGQTGWKLMYDFYEANRISRRETPVDVVIGGIPFRAFLVGLGLSANDPANVVGQFSLSFKYLPNQGTVDNTPLPVLA